MNVFLVAPALVAGVGTTAEGDTVTFPTATPRSELLLTNTLVLDVQPGPAPLTVAQSSDPALAASAPTSGTLIVVLALNTTDAEKVIFSSTATGLELYLSEGATRRRRQRPRSRRAHSRRRRRIRSRRGGRLGLRTLRRLTIHRERATCRTPRSSSSTAARSSPSQLQRSPTSFRPQPEIVAVHPHGVGRRGPRGRGAVRRARRRAEPRHPVGARPARGSSARSCRR